MLARPAPLVLADEQRVADTAAVLTANRLHAGRDLPTVRLQPDGEVTDLIALLAAREVMVLATGGAVADALRALLLGPVIPGRPASLLRAHPRLTVVCDRAAAAALPSYDGGHHVVVVLGHREPSISVEHRISRESLGRLERAASVAHRRPTLAAVLTGYTSTGGLSEAEQMQIAWQVAEVPTLLEVGGRDTAENATRSLPIVLALGEVRSVTIVTSAWHLRAPYHFLPWREHGLDVRFAFDWRGDWPRMLANELRGMRTMRTDRSQAQAAAR